MRLLPSYFIVIFALSYAGYNIVSLTDYFKQVKAYNEEQCFHIEGPIGIEDLIQYKHYLIGASNEYLSLFTQDHSLNKPNNGQMIALNTKTNHLLRISIGNFPLSIPFHPHGMYLFKTEYIYVINHSSSHGERVEVLQVRELKDDSLAFLYDHSVILPNGFNEITNDIAVIAHDEFYITASYGLERDKEGSLIKRGLFEVLNAMSVLFNYGSSSAYYYKNNTMTKVPYSNGIFNNGIAFDKNSQFLFIAQTVSKRIRVLEVDESDPTRARYKRDIHLDYALDNIHFDSHKGTLTAGIIGSIYDSFYYSWQIAHGRREKTGMFGGAVEVNLQQNDEVTLLVMCEDKMKTITSAIVVNSNVYLSSFGEKGVLVCPIPSIMPLP